MKLRMLNSHEQAFTFDELVEFRKQSEIEEAEPQPESDPKERTITILKLTAGVWAD